MEPIRDNAPSLIRWLRLLIFPFSQVMAPIKTFWRVALKKSRHAIPWVPLPQGSRPIRMGLICSPVQSGLLRCWGRTGFKKSRPVARTGPPWIPVDIVGTFVISECRGKKERRGGPRVSRRFAAGRIAGSPGPASGKVALWKNRKISSAAQRMMFKNQKIFLYSCSEPAGLEDRSAIISGEKPAPEKPFAEGWNSSGRPGIPPGSFRWPLSPGLHRPFSG